MRRLLGIMAFILMFLVMSPYEQVLAADINSKTNSVQMAQTNQPSNEKQPDKQEDKPKNSSPWYEKVLVWPFEILINTLGGIHEPGDHVFYNSCSSDEKCDKSVYGLYSQTQFSSVIKRGYVLFSLIVMALIVTAVVKSGVFFSFSRISSTMKVDLVDLTVKCFIASILLLNFFTVVGSVFKVNDYFVNLTYLDLKSPVNLSDYSPNVGTSRPGVDGRIELEKFADDQSGFGQVIVGLATKGISIWWEVFYLQRFVMITILLILAPLWISMLFYPTLQGITTTAMVELWSQIIAQAIHAVLFWIFFSLFDQNQMTWFQVLVLMSLFIPISESIRFIFGATSNSGGKLAMAGTLAGAGAMLNMGRMIQTARNGAPDMSNYQQQNNHSKQYGGGVSTASGSTSATSKLAGVIKAGQRIGGNVGSNAMRFGGSLVGMGFGGAAGSVLGGEAAARVGQAAGSRAGALAAGAGVGAKNWVQNTREHMNPSQAKEGADIDLTNSGQSVNAQQGVSFPKAAVRGLKGGVASSFDPAIRKANTESTYGAIGAVIGGTRGFEMGEKFANYLNKGRPLSTSDFNHGEQVYTVEDKNGSFLAKKGPDGGYQRMGNIGRGNPTLETGQTVVRAFNVGKENGQPFAFRPVMQGMGPQSTPPNSSSTPIMQEHGSSQSVISAPMSSPVMQAGGGYSVPMPAMSYTSEGKAVEYHGKTIDPYQFIDKGRQANHVDIRRRSMYNPSVKNMPSTPINTRIQK